VREVYAFAVTIPAGTPVGSPFTQNLSMPVRVVRAIDWRVPPGPAGMMGWALALAGQNVIPVNNGGWIITDNEYDTWNIDLYPTSGAWQLRGYNTGLFPHTVFVNFQCDLVQGGDTPSVPAPIPADLLSPMTAADLAAATAGQLSLDQLVSLSVPIPIDPSAGGVQ
jgi:hypothetical protein